MDSLPNAHGCLEYAREHGADVVLRGWMVDAAGAFETMHCEVAQRAIAAAPIDRPDLEPALPRVPGVRGAGFHLELPLNLLDGDGRVEFEVVGSRVGRRTARLHAGWLRSAAALPLPPLHLMQRVAHTQLDYLFAAGGMKTAFDFAAAARRVRTPASFARILDWGCGCGRVTAHLPALFPQASIHGVDIDGEAVAWAAAHLGGGGRFQRGGTLPPLPFGDAAFDLVLAGSVFTHLTADYQDRWLQELRRVLEPGGILIATTLGEFGARIRASDPALAQRLGAIGIDDSMPDRTLDGVVEAGYYRATWQGKAWTEQRWGRAFAVLHHEPAGFENYQDLWILRRPA